MTIAEMKAFLIAHVPGFNPASSDAAVADAYAAYQSGQTALEPLTVDEAKHNLRVTDTTTDDDYIAALIVAAREHVEGATGLVLTPRTVFETAPCLGRWIDLSAWPVTSVLVRYPVASVMTVLASSGYQASYRRRPVRLLPALTGWGAVAAPWGAPALPVEIEIVAGFATPADVPPTVKQAMHLLIAHWYGNRAAAEVGARAAAIDVPFGVDALLSRWKLARV